MKTKLLQTKDYLLLIDEEAEIKNKDWYYHTKYNHICQCRAEPNMNMVEAGCKKIVAYHPLNSEAKELDLPLLPPFEYSFDITSWAKNEHKYNHRSIHELSFILGCEVGYKEAQSDKQFTLEDMKKAFFKGRESLNKALVSDIEAEEIIQSLSTQQLPSEFIPEYQRVRDWDSRDINGDYNSKLVLKTITNSEGKEEIQGTYKY